MKLVTIPNVPLVETGDCLLQSGPHTFTEEELAAAVAALGDPAVLKPRVGIDGLDEFFDPEAHGGEPAFGHIDNMRLSADGQQVIGDMVVPDFIADKLEWAYPARSIEGALGWDSPQTAKRHELVITAVKLLGVDWPGSRTLPDLAEVFAAQDQDSTPVTEEVVLARAPQSGNRIQAGLDQDLIRRRFMDQLEAGNIDLPAGVGAYDLWIRSMRFDDSGTPYLKVQDEGSGDLYRLDFTVSGSEVTFGDFVEVVEQDVAVAAASDALRTPPLAVYASRAESRAIRATDRRQEGGNVNPEAIRRLREAAGLTEAELPDNATDDQLNAALDRVGPKAETPPAEETEETEVEETTETTETEETTETPEQIAARAKLPKGVRVIDEATLTQLQAGAKTAQDLAAKSAREDRDRVITAAISDGKVMPSRKAHFERLWDADADGTRTLLTASTAEGGLEAGQIPVTERGQQPQEGDLDGGLGYDPDWLPPEIKARVLAEQAGTPVAATNGPGARIIREV